LKRIGWRAKKEKNGWLGRFYWTIRELRIILLGLGFPSFGLKCLLPLIYFRGLGNLERSDKLAPTRSTYVWPGKENSTRLCISPQTEEEEQCFEVACSMKYGEVFFLRE
jgi:hypothetical protein